VNKIVEAAHRMLTAAAVSDPPVPVDKLVRDAGVVVSYQPFDADDISGLLYRAADSAAVIGVNSNNAKVRQRFTIAHELGHLILHERQELILDRHVQVNFRDTTSSTATNQEEIEANQFAAELLMPQDLLERSLQSLLAGRPLTDIDLVRRLASRFEVSHQAMEFRLASVGMLTPS
jgi:Zn-dependent peptidase ImmA (M78 family)